MRFMNEKLLHEKHIRHDHKKKLYTARKEFDQLYQLAQEFIQNSDDQDKVQELLDLLDEDQRSELLSQYREKTQASKQGKNAKRLVNFTTESFKKYDNVKITNLVGTLQAHGLEPDIFAKEVQGYFNYHADRK